jgi:pentatricopeptide repeat protein
VGPPPPPPARPASKIASADAHKHMYMCLWARPERCLPVASAGTGIALRASRRWQPQQLGLTTPALCGRVVVARPFVAAAAHTRSKSRAMNSAGLKPPPGIAGRGGGLPPQQAAAAGLRAPPGVAKRQPPAQARQAARAQQGGWRDPLASGAARRANEYVCELCQVVTSSLCSLEAHKNGRAHKRKVRMMQREKEDVGAKVRDTRDKALEHWDGTTQSDGSRAVEPQVIDAYGNQALSAQGIFSKQREGQIIQFYATRGKRKASQAHTAGGRGGKRHKGGHDPVAPFRRRIGLANRDGDIVAGLSAFDEMHEAGLQAETKTYNSVLSLCASGGASRWQDAIRVYEAFPVHGCVPDEGTYTCMIRICGLAQRLERGLQLLREMRTCKINPKRRTYSPLLAACALDGCNIDQALELMADSKAYDVELFEEDYANLVKVCTLANDSTRLVQLVLPQMMEQCYTISQSTRQTVELWARNRAAAGERLAPVHCQAFYPACLLIYAVVPTLLIPRVTIVAAPCRW